MEKTNKKGLKIAIFSLCGLLCGAICIAPNSVTTRAETGADSMLQTGSYWWAQGAEIVYQYEVEDKEYFRSTTAPWTIKGADVPQTDGRTNRTTYFQNNAGANIDELKIAYEYLPHENIRYYGKNAHGAFICRANKSDIDYTYWAKLSSVTWQIKGRKVYDLEYFIASVRDTYFTIVGGNTCIGQITVYNFTEQKSETHGLSITMENNRVEGEEIADILEERLTNYKRIGKNGRSYVVIDTLFIQFNGNITQTNGARDELFYFDYTPTSYLDNNTYVLSVNASPWAIEWKGEIGLFGFIDDFFKTEIFSGFTFGTLLFIAVGGLLVGMLLKIFLGG